MNSLTSDNPMIQAVAFDMDGLMFNTEDLYDQVGEILLQRRGQRFNSELKLKMMGRPGRQAFAIMIEHCGIDDTVEQLQNESELIFLNLLPKKIEMMPGLLELLDLIDRYDLPKCVATSSHRQFANRAIGKFELQSRFDFILTAEDVEYGKPNPDVYLLAAKRLGVEVASMLVLEDSLNGSLAAATAGAHTVAVPTSHSIGNDFSHTQHVASSLSDPYILEILLKGRS